MSRPQSWTHHDPPPRGGAARRPRLSPSAVRWDQLPVLHRRADRRFRTRQHGLSGPTVTVPPEVSASPISQVPAAPPPERCSEVRLPATATAQVEAGNPLSIDLFDPFTTTRFWTQVLRPSADDCWEWTGTRREFGYGLFFIGELKLRAHRVSFLLNNGWLPIVVMHDCDNPPCVNPRHLRGGTMADNNRDRDAKGRSRHGCSLPGEQNPNSKLTAADVLELRAMHPRPALAVLAERYGVHDSTISSVLVRRSWRHV